MQDNYAPETSLVDSWAQVIVHPRLVDWLRRATYAEIGTTAEALDTAAFADDREEHPERFRAPAQSLRESYALLDRIGWAKTVPPVAVPIELDGDCWALVRALNGAIEFADDEVYEVSRDTDVQLLACEHERVRELYDFMDDVRGRIDMLAVQEGALAIPDLVA